VEISYARILSQFCHQLLLLGVRDICYHLINLLFIMWQPFSYFLFILGTLRLPLLRDRYGERAYAISALATVFWAINPVQVLAVSYVVQRMASMAGYVLHCRHVLLSQGTHSGGNKKQSILFPFALPATTLLALGSKETSRHAAGHILSMISSDPGAERDTVRKNLKFAFSPFRHRYYPC